MGRLIRLAAPWVDLVMMRRQLRNLGALAECTAAEASP